MALLGTRDGTYSDGGRSPGPPPKPPRRTRVLWRRGRNACVWPSERFNTRLGMESGGLLHERRCQTLGFPCHCAGKGYYYQGSSELKQTSKFDNRTTMKASKYSCIFNKVAAA